MAFWRLQYSTSGDEAKRMLNLGGRVDVHGLPHSFPVAI